MKDFLLIFKVLYRNSHSTERNAVTGRKKLPQSTVMVLSLLPMVVLICVFLGFVSAGITTRYTIMTLLNATLSAVQFFVLFLTMSSILSTLYTASDSAFLSSLPVSRTSVFFARMAIVYIEALKIAALFLLPTMLTVAVTFNIAAGSMFYGFYPLLPVVVIMTPVLPLFLVVLFSMPVIWLGTFFRSRAVTKTIFSLLFYVLLMVVYMVFVLYINSTGFRGDGLSESATEALEIFSDIMYPNRTLLLMCLGIDAAANFGITAGVFAAMVAVTVALAALFYKRITTRGLETPKEERRPRRAFKPTSTVNALMRKDFLTIMRNSFLAMSTFANILLAPILMAVMYFFTGGSHSDLPDNPMTQEMMTCGIALLYCIVFLAGTNTVAMTAFSREGESFFISKFLPVSPSKFVAAKLIFALTVSGAAMVIMAAIALFLYKIGIVSAVCIFVASMLFCAGASSLHIYFDMKRGNVHWKNISDMRNQMNGNLLTVIPVLLSVVPGVLFIFAGVFVAELQKDIGAAGVYAVYWAIVLAVSAVVAFTGLYILREKGVPAFDKIGELKTVQTRSPAAVGRGSGGGFLK